MLSISPKETLVTILGEIIRTKLVAVGNTCNKKMPPKVDITGPSLPPAATGPGSAEQKQTTNEEKKLSYGVFVQEREISVKREDFA
jgi:hypothetical protein